MISQVPLDSMHLIDLGVVKKILEQLMLWKVTGFTTDAETRLVIDEDFKEYTKFTPSEFQRAHGHSLITEISRPPKAGCSYCTQDSFFKKIIYPSLLINILIPFQSPIE